MGSGVTVTESIGARQRLRTFHISGKGMDRAIPDDSLWPAALEGVTVAQLQSTYPLHIAPEQRPRPLAEMLSGAENPGAMDQWFRAAMGDRDCVPLAEIRNQVLGPYANGSRVPTDGLLVAFDSQALPLLHAAALAASRAEHRRRLLKNLQECRDGLKDLIAVDDGHAPEAGSPDKVYASLGSGAATFFDAGALAVALQRPLDGVHAMSPERRERVEGTLATIEAALRDWPEQPAFWLFHSDAVPAAVNYLGGRCRSTNETFREALEFCDRQLERFAVTLRAMRSARRDIEGGYDPAIHDEWLERFDWQGAASEEIAAMPAVVVLESADRLANISLTAFGKLLRSGRPVQVLVTCSGLDAGALDGFAPDFGYLAIAHREAFVLQSSLARVDHLLSGLGEMASTLRPAVAVVSVPESVEDAERAWLQLSLIFLSGALPLFRYDPERGERWAQRFALLDGVPATLNAVHAAALSTLFRAHFRLVPDGECEQELLELQTYLDKFVDRPPLAIPYIWVVDRLGNRRRAALTRELVNLCRERQRAFRLFVELAGVRDQPKAPDANSAEARRAGAAQAIHRMLELLTGQTVAMPTKASVPPPATPAVSAAIRDVTPSDASTDAFIDSFLCTSCTDCMKVNPRVFGYDANKQAYIADAGAGTYAELVRAAEGCPARCIHPGMPKAGDKTATPEVLAKAAKFQ